MKGIYYRRQIGDEYCVGAHRRVDQEFFWAWLISKSICFEFVKDAFADSQHAAVPAHEVIPSGFDSDDMR